MHLFAAVILVDRRGWILLQERDEDAPIDPDTWSLSGGHVERGEEFEPAAHRELLEETGIVLAPGRLRLWREIEVFHAVYDSLDRMQVFVAACDLSDDDITVGEGRQIVFVEPAVARTLTLSTAATTLVPDFLDSDTYRKLCP